MPSSFFYTDMIQGVTTFLFRNLIIYHQKKIEFNLYQKGSKKKESLRVYVACLRSNVSKHKTPWYFIIKTKEPFSYYFKGTT